MTLGASGLTFEECFSARSGLLIEAALRWLRSRNRELVKLQRAELRCDHIVGAALIAETCFSSNRILIGVVEALVKKGSLSIQLEVAHVSIPVGNCAPATAPGMKIDTGHSKCRWDKSSGRLPIGAKRFSIEI